MQQRLTDMQTQGAAQIAGSHPHRRKTGEIRHDKQLLEIASVAFYQGADIAATRVMKSHDGMGYAHVPRIVRRMRAASHEDIVIIEFRPVRAAVFEDGYNTHTR